jgi:two-component system, NarL family, invasion response regulator UvrY
METQTINIAFAEDHSLVRNGIIELIHNSSPFRVIADAENGKELINKITALSPTPDICILDINMPVMDGYSTITELKQMYPEMRFLILTISDIEYSIIRMIKRGANGYLVKRCKIQELLEAIMTIYTHEYYYSAFASEKVFRMIRSNKIPELSKKELEFLTLCCSDLSYSAIAEIMYISTRTVEGYQKRVSAKLNIHSRIGLALFAMQSGLVAAPGKNIND